MAHSWDEIELTPLRHGVEAPVCSRHILVVFERVERREPRIAIAVVEDQLPSVRGEGRQIRGHRIHKRLAGRQSFLINVHCHVRRRRPENAGSG